MLEEHREYLADQARLDAYGAALRELVTPGDVVLDLASGTGILGLLACRAGAARVHAVEAEPIVTLARAIACANGYADRIDVQRCHSSDARLPERADLAVSDQIGRFGFEAGLIPLFADARARLLRTGGRLIPSHLDLIIAPVEHAAQFDHVSFWAGRPAGFDFAEAEAVAANTGYAASFTPEHLLAAPVTGCRLDLAATSATVLRIDVAFTAVRAGWLDGIGGWFSARLSPSVTISNSPLDPRRIRRQQVYFPIGRRVEVEPADRIAVRMEILHEEVVVAWTVEVTSAAGSTQRYAHSTLRGMLLDPEDLRRTDPAYRPVLTARGVARRSVLALCDGSRSVAQIEAEIFARHGALFQSPSEAAVFVAQILSRYTHGS